ncbi:MAG: ABC transporter substrate-binding protein [Kiloniellaceae bacterium]
MQKIARTGLLAGGMLLAATSAGQAANLVWARDGDIDSLDPHRATSTLSRQFWYQIYDSLLEFDENGAPVANLAKAWTVSPDGKQVVFELNDGIKCHDGTAFDADDVKWTIDRALGDKNPSLTKASWGPITAVTKVDRLNVKIDLSEPFGAFIPFLADQFTSMLCDSNKDAENFGVSSAVGTGPWKFVSWVKGSEIVLARNEDYTRYGRPVDNAGAPYVDSLTIITMPEGQTRMAGLRTGELHIVVPPIEEVEDIQKDDSIDLFLAQNSGQNMFLEFSFNRPPFNDARARKAIAHAIDFEAALDIVFGGLVERELCPVSQGVFGNSQEFCAAHGQDYDPDKAMALLKELGYGPDNPLPVTLMTWTGDSREKLLQVFQNMLKQVGVKAGIEVMDIGTLNARVKTENNKQDGPGTIDLMGWTWFDPDVLYLLWRSPGAYEGYTQPDLDVLLDTTRTAVTEEERMTAVRGTIAHLLENAVHVPVYTPGWLWMYAVTDKAPGFKIGPFNRPLFNDVKL